MTHTPDNVVVWTEIPVRDLDAAITFYNTVFDLGIAKDEGSPMPMATFPNKEGSVAGHLYPGEPAAAGTGPTIHMIVPDTLEASLKRFEAAGGTPKPGIIALPFGRFGYATDPDGNSIGLYQPNAA